ncbi:hypothetical protein SAMN05216369_2187 [Marinobacter antarcticus]|uniref:Uncharacterized protein n=1 Tax=Marinobacter antarcticus TaxID=564117 RepID=A0A1M6SQ44_9GAMM|nr:hypothetical protein [Marinobacter antarcticus]SHK46874.1 hypothetical protein SAMN05216369_2187 [Marinobacter antarcticus]
MKHNNLPPGCTASSMPAFSKAATRIETAMTVTLAKAASMPSFAGVKAMTSDEMVETYVKDSASG